MGLGLKKNKWTALFLSNFLGVFNDNLLKNSVIFVAVTWALPRWMTQSQLISLVSASLVLPYLILSPVGGRLAVLHSKKKIFRFFKLLEIPIMLFASLSFYFQWVFPAVLSVLIMGTQSCLYSPSKYSLIRDIGGEEGAAFGSGMFETMAFLGILIGTIVASVVSDHYSFILVSSLFLFLALAGYMVTRQIRATEQPEATDDKAHLNPLRFLVDSFRFAAGHKHVNSAVFGASAFWLIGGMLQMNIVIHTKHIYHTENTQTGLVMAVAAIGIATGCWTAGKISGKRAKKGLILIGSITMAAMFLLLATVRTGFPVYAVLVGIAAFAGGFVQVPSLAIIQQSDLGRKIGDVFAYLNLVTFILVLFGTLIFSLTTYFSSENSMVVFGVLSFLCFVVFIYFLFVSPDFRKDL